MITNSQSKTNQPDRKEYLIHFGRPRYTFFMFFSSLLCCWPEGKECPAAPALEEWRVCSDHPCIVFHWEASAWGPCIEDTSMDFNVTSFWNGTPACAVGVQIRKVSCMKMNVGPVVSKRYAVQSYSCQASHFYCALHFSRIFELKWFIYLIL